MKKLMSLLVALTTALCLSCTDSAGSGAEADVRRPFSNYSNESILQWNNVTLGTMHGPAYNPMLASRIYAMVHVAIHDALNSIEPSFDTYALQVKDKKADPIAALSNAAYTVLVNSFPDRKNYLDSALAVSLADVKANDARARGLQLGKLAGEAILALREGDGAFQNPVAELNNPDDPGLYQLVPPVLYLAAPFWKDLRTFGLSSPHQFRVAAMPSLNSNAYVEAFDEVRQYGSKESVVRTEDQTAIAKFWYEFSEIGWNRVAATAVVDGKLDLLSTARVFALVNVAMADAYIAGWDSKFHHNFWRPYTAIRKASTDGNANTNEDAAWEPLMVTPPVHDYPSTHSTLGNAAAVVLNELIGEKVGFSMTSSSAEPAGSLRTFASFSHAAQENATSRVLAGIHFRFSCDSGLALGDKIGHWVLDTKLKPKQNKGL
ncbi:vanadium-dependent haloperoxidase [Pseudochryseolinea flava]|uniref:Phosphoesterase PA-phosphatase n=1 Tax=Pseudochryseolinea flava TaxID=2059302 RepID=A0A364Y6C4_9BACT|nr:vanadium-dependent haloperoxidase [Pseudochryseolinea flava]RAW02355.1 phosphoesterase PA-phosphatase [Pseudochryseolinea flava]